MDNINSTSTLNTTTSIIKKALAVPSNLSAGVSPNSITLTWDDNSLNESIFTVKRTNVTQVVNYTVAANGRTFTGLGAAARILTPAKHLG